MYRETLPPIERAIVRSRNAFNAGTSNSTSAIARTIDMAAQMKKFAHELHD